MGQLEEYLQGKPLSDAHKVLMFGEPEANPQPSAQMPDMTLGASLELTDDERDWLKHLRGEPGWHVLLKVLQRGVDRRERSALSLSQSDPLGRKDEIAHAWMYVACLRTLVVELLSSVETEIALLEQEL